MNASLPKTVGGTIWMLIGCDIWTVFSSTLNINPIKMQGLFILYRRSQGGVRWILVEKFDHQSGDVKWVQWARNSSAVARIQAPPKNLPPNYFTFPPILKNYWPLVIGPKTSFQTISEGNQPPHFGKPLAIGHWPRNFLPNYSRG